VAYAAGPLVSSRDLEGGNPPDRAGDRACLYLAGLDLDLDVNASRKLDPLKRIDRLGVGVDDIDQSFVDSHLEVLTRCLVDVRAAYDRVAMLVGREWNRSSHGGVGPIHSLDDLTRRLIDDFVIERLEANSNALCHVNVLDSVCVCLCWVQVT
jgi:hypothetical protein